MSDPVRIIITDDHPVVRKGLRLVIEEEPDLKVVGEAGDGRTALELISRIQPDIALLDLDMPLLDGFAVTAEIRKAVPRVKVIILTIHSEPDLLHRAMNLGASGYIVKESALVDIVNGISSVTVGRPFVSPSLTAALLERRARTQALKEAAPGLRDLTRAEERVLAMVAAGKATQAIASELHVHPRTIESHRASICHKLGLNGNNSLLRFVLEHRSEFSD